MYKIGTVSYLNARPLVSRIDRSQYEVFEGHPAEVARRLGAGEVDIALVPVAAALSTDNLRILGEHCIGAEGPVRSVLLVSEQPPESWTEVLLDGVSRTSVTLARLLLTEGPLVSRVRTDLVIKDAAPGTAVQAAAGSVAALVIGDAARQLPERFTHRLDLAELWHDWTGLPFVFAVWAGRPGLDVTLLDHIRAAGRAGLAAREQEYQGEDLEYLTRHIRYSLDDRALVGLRRYGALAHRAGLVRWEDVEMYGPPTHRRQRPTVDHLLAKAAENQPLSPQELASLHEDAPTADLGLAADLARQAMGLPIDPGFRLAYRIDLRGDQIHDVDLDPARREAADAREAGAEIWVTGEPNWDLAFWERALEALAGPGLRAGNIDIWAALARRAGRTLPEVADYLRSAGVTGFAEDAAICLHAPTRRRADLLEPRAWLEAATSLLDTGWTGTFGLELGAGEDLPARRTHLAATATLARSYPGVSAFRVAPLSPARGLNPVGATAEDVLRTLAIARLQLPASVHLESGWLTEAPGLTQTSIRGGADRIGTVLLPPRDLAVDAPYVNPRAAVGRRRDEDPWDRYLKKVKWNLSKAGVEAGT